MSRPITFKTWLLKFECVDFPIGDLAKDVKADKSFPKENNKEAILNYLHFKRANYDAIQTFEDAWDYYLKSR